MSLARYRRIDHTADLGVEITGADPKALFSNAALALTDLLMEGKPPQKRHRHSVVLQGQDWADLMVNWLRELLYMCNGRQQVISAVRIHTLSETQLQADVFADDFSPEQHIVRNEIKAVTYHQIRVEPYEQGWRAQVIFDI